LSWILLGGRCRSCRAPISLRYLIVEALTALLFLLAAERCLGGPEWRWGAYAVVCALGAALIAASFIDIDLRILPDEITVRGMMAAPFVVLLVPDLHTRPVDRSLSWLLVWAEPYVAAAAARLPAFLASGAGLAAGTAAAAGAGFGLGLYGSYGYWRFCRRAEAKPLRHALLGGVLGMVAGGAGGACLLRPEWLLAPRAHALWAAFAGMLVGSGLVFLVGVVGTRVFRKPAMGFGDVKLMGLLGAFTGWAGVVSALFLACILGSAVGIYLFLRTRSRYLPFGPFLALGAMVMIIRPEAVESLLAWYLSLF
jgi:leader peptidase (prepilin peptidase)/N-methyltransferase